MNRDAAPGNGNKFEIIMKTTMLKNEMEGVGGYHHYASA